MSAAAFIRLNGRGLNLETAKQTKIRVDDLLKVLRICRLGPAEAGGPHYENFGWIFRKFRWVWLIR